MTRNSIEPRTKRHITGYGCLSFARNLSNKYEKKLTATATKTGLDAAKTASKRRVHKAVNLMGNKSLKKL